MKKHLALFLLLVASFAYAAPDKGERVKKNINREWRFYLGEPDGNPENKEYDDSRWERVGLPHSFSIPYFRKPDFYVGYGWYRKTFECPSDWKGKRLFLEFDGVFQVAEIYVNGEWVGEHKGGYTGFSVDVTKYCRPENNTIAVRVNNLWNGALAPRAGEHVFSGGIYRDVYLTMVDPLHFAWNGVAVATPEVTAQTARAVITAEVKNDALRDQHCIVRASLKDPEGKIITIAEKEIKVKAGTMETVRLEMESVKRPSLWSPESPALYKVELSLVQEKRLKDKQVVSFGFRSIEWDAEKGFFLNGQHYYLRGVNVHQDQAGWGDAITKTAIRRDIQMMKEAGFNFIRGSHYPHHPYFAEACDELGMFFLSENCVWGIGGFKDDGYWDSSTYPVREEDEAGYRASALTTLEEMIRINRNSPSILAWSMSNEPFFTAKATSEKMKNLLRELSGHCKKIDPSRAVVIGGAQRGGIDKLGDIAGYNGDGATLYLRPGVPSMVTEYGSCVADRPGEYIPCWGDVKDGAEPQWRSGHAIWCGFDHGSIAGDMGKMGIVDYFRIPKRSWYWYRNHLKGIPPPEWPAVGEPSRLLLTADKNVINGTDATDDILLNVKVLNKEGKQISNSPAVTLTIVSGPGEFPTGRSITFRETTEDDIRILDGQAAITFRSYEGGKSLIRATADGLESSEFVVETVGEPAYREGITPLVKERKVKNYKLGVSAEAIDVAQARPTRASSVKNGTVASWANDGDVATVWEAGQSEGEQWWQLDMENFYVVSEITVMIPQSACHAFKVEVSEDAVNWKTAGFPAGKDQSVFRIPAFPDSYGRFLRIVFSDCGGRKVCIAEVGVKGSTR